MIISALFAGLARLPLWVTHRRNPVTGLYDRRCWRRWLGQ